MLSISIRPCPYTVLITIVYYRLYSRESALASKTFFKKDEPSLDRINHATTDHEVSQNTHFGGGRTQRLQLGYNPYLFQNIFSEKDIGNGTISFLGASHPGQQEDQPMAVLYNPDDLSTVSKRLLLPLQLRQQGQSQVLS